MVLYPNNIPEKRKIQKGKSMKKTKPISLGLSKVNIKGRNKKDTLKDLKKRKRE